MHKKGAAVTVSGVMGPSMSSARSSMLHSPSAQCEEKATNQEDAKEENGSRFMAENMRNVDLLFYRPLGGPVKPTSQGDRRDSGVTDPLGELEAILTYVEHVTAALSNREHVATPAESLHTVKGPVVASRRALNTSEKEVSARRSLAMELHDKACALLGWINRLEYVTVSQNISLKELEKAVSSSAASVNAVLDAVDVRYRNHEVADVQEFFLGSRETLKNCRDTVHGLVMDAQKVLVLRQTVACRDLAHAKELFNGHWKARCSNGPPRPTCPFVAWVEGSWFPAMEKWEQIVAAVRNEAEMGDVKGAFARGQQLVLTESSMISKIIRPGETLSDLLHQYLEKPLEAIERSLNRKKNCIEALRAALAVKDGKRLVECLCAVEELRFNEDLSEGDAELVERARKQIVCQQQVDNVVAALKLAVQASETVTLFRAIHQANELLLQLGIVGNPEVAKDVVRSSGTILKEMCALPSGTSLVEFVAKRVDPMTVNLAHVPSHVWTSEATATYQAAWQCLTARTVQNLVRFQQEGAKESDDSTTCSWAARSADVLSTSSNNAKGNSQQVVRFARAQTQHTEVGDALSVQRLFPVGQWSEPTLKFQVTKEKTITQEEGLKLKVHFDAQVRVLRIHAPDKCSFHEIYKRVCDLCMQQVGTLPPSTEHKLRMRYEDTEGDCISLLTQEDWNVLVSEQAPNGLEGTKLDIYCDFPPVPLSRLRGRTSPSSVSKERSVSPAPVSPQKPCIHAREAVEKATQGFEERITAEAVEKSVREVSNRLPKSLVESRKENGTRTAGNTGATKQVRCQSTGFALRKSNLSSGSVSTGRITHDDFHVQKHNRKLKSTVKTASTTLKDPVESDILKEVSPSVHEKSNARRNLTNPSSLQAQFRAVSTRHTHNTAGGVSCVSPKVGKLVPTPTEAKKLQTPIKSAGGATRVSVCATTGAEASWPGEPVEAVARRWKDDETPLELDAVASTVNQGRTTAPNRKGPAKASLSVKQSSTKAQTTTPRTGSRPKCVTEAATPSDSAMEEKREWSVCNFRPGEIRATTNGREETPPSTSSRVRVSSALDRAGSSGFPGASGLALHSNNNGRKVDALLRYRQMREEKLNAVRASAVQKRAAK
uniref:PB1 domain-containing protein n=1 Tax=Trypanosoma congolense (strain IL3000) TaxID=1068625 RepID=G0UV84_TRYCI|nr:conserved hypothetical protein [Trypanosoma congolense IL3000]